MTLLKNRNKLIKSSNLIPAFILISLGMSSVGLILAIVNVVGVLYIGGKPAPSLVQLYDGRSVMTEPVDKYYRTPQVITEFVKQTMSLLFTWNATSQIQDEDGTVRNVVSDKGIEIGSEKVTTRTQKASVALAEDFRVEMLEVIAKLTPNEVFEGTAQSVLNIDSISNPLKIDDGRWQLNMVSTLLIFDSRNPQGLAIPFNKTIIVSAVEPAIDPLPEESRPIQKAVYEIRSRGLVIDEIYEIGAVQNRE